MSSPRTPVLIVGGGPVGLCLALFLDHWDVPCTILNTGETARMHPKGNGQNARTSTVKIVAVSEMMANLCTRLY